MKIALPLALFALPLLAQQPVRYELSFPNAAHYEAEIRATFSGVRQPVLELVMSNSSPGHDELLSRAGFLLEKQPGGGAWIGNPQLSFGASGAEIVGPTLHGSPIYEAGLDRGNRITQFDGKSLSSQQDLNTILEAHKPGEKIKLVSRPAAGARISRWRSPPLLRCK